MLANDNIKRVPSHTRQLGDTLRCEFKDKKGNDSVPIIRAHKGPKTDKQILENFNKPLGKASQCQFLCVHYLWCMMWIFVISTSLHFTDEQMKINTSNKLRTLLPCFWSEYDQWLNGVWLSTLVFSLVSTLVESSQLYWACVFFSYEVPRDKQASEQVKLNKPNRSCPILLRYRTELCCQIQDNPIFYWTTGNPRHTLCWQFLLVFLATSKHENVCRKAITADTFFCLALIVSNERKYKMFTQNHRKYFWECTMFLFYAGEAKHSMLMSHFP